MSYEMLIPPEYDSNHNLIPNAPTATVAFAWTVPYASQGFFGGIIPVYPDANTPINTCVYQSNAAGGFQPECTSVGNETYGLGLNYKSLAEITADTSGGTGAAFELNQTAPFWSSNATYSGYPGQSIIVQGANFDTNGFTQIFFDAWPLSGVSCPTSTQCSAPIPSGFATGPVTVTINVFGARTNAGTFTFLPPGPACTYSVVTVPSTGDGFINADCTGDSLEDEITIYQINNGATGQYWSAVYDYAGSKTLEEIAGGGPGTSDQFEACLTVNGVNAYPGQDGCDPLSTVTIPPVFHFHPIQIGHLQ
jgi:hypothetical protein